MVFDFLGKFELLWSLGALGVFSIVTSAMTWLILKLKTNFFPGKVMSWHFSALVWIFTFLTLLLVVSISAWALASVFRAVNSEPKPAIGFRVSNLVNGSYYHDKTLPNHLAVTLQLKVWSKTSQKIYPVDWQLEFVNGDSKYSSVIRNVRAKLVLKPSFAIEKPSQLNLTPDFEIGAKPKIGAVSFLTEASREVLKNQKTFGVLSMLASNGETYRVKFSTTELGITTNHP